MKFEFAGQNFEVRWWTPESGCLGDIIAFDSETAVGNRGEIPPYVLGQAFAGGGTVWLIRLEYLRNFFEVHRESIVVAHNASFDICVVEQEAGFDFDPQIRGQKFFDTGLMYCLLALATEGNIPPWNLAYVAKKVLGVDLPKDEDVRLTFGQYRTDDTIAYEEISEAHIEYASKDPIATFCIFLVLFNQIKELDPDFFLSHKIQLMGAYALYRIQTLGIGFDQSRKRTFLESVDAEIADNLGKLQTYGYVPGQKGIKTVYKNVINNLGIDLPLTDSRLISERGEHLQKFRDEVPFIDALLTYRENKKLRDFVVNLKTDRIHTRFNPLVKTGRTSSFDPNIQNLPRRPGVRECFVPAPGYCFLIIDYAQLELCTLAQVCLDKFGFSKMADLINQNTDLHSWFAGQMTGKTITKEDPERQWAKACNFGFGGGMGIPRFVKAAKDTYGVDLSEERARELKAAWLESFPEMRLYLADTLPSRHNFSSIGDWCDPDVAVSIFKRIIAGEPNRDGRDYSQNLKDWAFKTVLPEIAPTLEGIEEGSPELKDKALREIVVTRTGRIKANCTYCQARNTPFQGLAADGGKIAKYRLVRAGYRLVNFVHDEFLIEVALNADLDVVATDVDRIIVGAMRSVVPDVLIKADWIYSDRWYKDAKLIRNSEGKPQIYSGSSTANPVNLAVGAELNFEFNTRQETNVH